MPLPDPVYIRSLNPNAFRSGQWAEILRVTYWRPEHIADGVSKMVYVVRFPDMTFDQWAIYDNASLLYEFTDERPEEFQEAKRQWLAGGSMPWWSTEDSNG